MLNKHLMPGYKLGIVVGGADGQSALNEVLVNLGDAAKKASLVGVETSGMSALAKNLGQLEPLLADA